MNIKANIDFDGSYDLVLEHDDIELHGYGATLADALSALAEEAYREGL